MPVPALDSGRQLFVALGAATTRDWFAARSPVQHSAGHWNHHRHQNAQVADRFGRERFQATHRSVALAPLYVIGVVTRILATSSVVHRTAEVDTVEAQVTGDVLIGQQLLSEGKGLAGVRVVVEPREGRVVRFVPRDDEQNLMNRRARRPRVPVVRDRDRDEGAARCGFR